MIRREVGRRARCGRGRTRRGIRGRSRCTRRGRMGWRHAGRRCGSRRAARCSLGQDWPSNQRRRGDHGSDRSVSCHGYTCLLAGHETNGPCTGKFFDGRYKKACNRYFTSDSRFSAIGRQGASGGDFGKSAAEKCRGLIGHVALHFGDRFRGFRRQRRIEAYRSARCARHQRLGLNRPRLASALPSSTYPWRACSLCGSSSVSFWRSCAINAASCCSRCFAAAMRSASGSAGSCGEPPIRYSTKAPIGTISIASSTGELVLLRDVILRAARRGKQSSLHFQHRAGVFGCSDASVGKIAIQFDQLRAVQLDRRIATAACDGGAPQRPRERRERDDSEHGDRQPDHARRIMTSADRPVAVVRLR